MAASVNTPTTIDKQRLLRLVSRACGPRSAEPFLLVISMADPCTVAAFTRVFRVANPQCTTERAAGKCLERLCKRWEVITGVKMDESSRSADNLDRGAVTLSDGLVLRRRRLPADVRGQRAKYDTEFVLELDLDGTRRTVLLRQGWERDLHAQLPAPTGGALPIKDGDTVLPKALRDVRLDHASLAEALIAAEARRLGARRLREYPSVDSVWAQGDVVHHSVDLINVVAQARVAGEPVRELRLSCAEIAPDMLARLLCVPELAGVRELYLDRVPLGRAGIQALITVPVLSQLTALGLDGAGVGFHGIRLLADAGCLHQLCWLDASGNKLPTEALDVILQTCPALESLFLGENFLDEDAPLVMARSAGQPWKTRLQLNGNQLEDLGLDRLREAGLLLNVIELRLARNGLTSRSVSRFARCPDVSSLAELDLRGNAIDDRGALALARSKHLTALTQVALCANPFTTRTTRAMRVNARMKSFERSCHAWGRGEDLPGCLGCYRD